MGLSAASPTPFPPPFGWRSPPGPAARSSASTIDRSQDQTGLNCEATLPRRTERGEPVPPSVLAGPLGRGRDAPCSRRWLLVLGDKRDGAGDSARSSTGRSHRGRLPGWCAL